MYRKVNAVNAGPADWRPRTIALAIGLALAAPASAQEAVPVMQEVLVTGQAASMDSALDVQQMADNIVSVVHADAIGQLPDSNAAEALQRIPGLSVERDQGEGRYVRVRGLGPELNSVTINGSLVPAPESDTRAVALDVLPAGLIRSLEVSKSLTPDQDANSIGGTIEVKTISAFDHKGMFYSLEGGASYDSNVEQSSPWFAGAWSNVFMDGKLGVAFGLSSAKRKFGSNNVETGGAWDGNQLEEFERRDYTITRERQGAVFNLDYRPDSDSSYYLRTLYSRYADDEIRQAHIVEFDDPMSPGVLGDAESERELKAREEEHRIFSLVLGTEQKLANNWKLAAAVGASRAEQETPKGINATFASGNTYSVGYSSRSKPRLLGGSAINTAGDYELDEIAVEDQLTRDREHNARLDLSHNYKMWGGDNELKFGAKLSRRKKTNELTAWEIDGGDFGNPTIADGYASGSVSYPWGSFGPGISRSAIRSLVGSIGDLTAAGYLDDEESRINDFTMHENINAAYVQNTYSLGLWRILAGVRYEGTRFRAEGTKVDNGVFSATKSSTSYDDWLPSLHLRRDLDDATTIRAAWSNAVVRPSFGQLAPGVVIDGDEAEFGNPLLKPMKAANFDLGIERRLGYAGVVSAYAFHKKIKNFAYTTDLAGTGAWAAFDEAITYANGDKATVSGMELAYSQRFSQLPAPWNGLLLAANATFTTSRAGIEGLGVSRHIPLPSQSKRTFNLTLGWENGPWNLRLAANHKSRYLLEVSDLTDASKDIYVDAQTQYDFSARYQVSRQLQVVFEALNLGDEKYYTYAGSRSRNAQYESYGRTFRLGLKLATF